MVMVVVVVVVVMGTTYISLMMIYEDDYDVYTLNVRLVGLELWQVRAQSWRWAARTNSPSSEEKGR